MTVLRFLAAGLLASAQNTYAIDIVAHRGYACDGPENSIQSIERAWRAGADGVEVDVRVSGDGVPFLFHDAEIGRVSIADLSFAEISALNEEPIATLAAMLERVPGEGYYVFDLKTDDPDRLDAILDVVLGSGLEPGSMSFQSGSLQALDRIRHRVPGARLTFLSELKWTVPYLLHPSARELTAMLRNRAVDRVSIKGRSFVNKRFVDAIKATGREVHVWTINNPGRAVHYRKLGVDGLITDRVEGLLPETAEAKHRDATCPTSDADAV